MHKKFYSFLTTLFFIICLVPFHANADLGGMLKQLEKMGKKLDGLGEKKTPSPDQSAPSFQSSLTNRSFQFQWYLKQAGKRDYKVLSQQVYFGKKGKMWGLLSSKEKGMRNPYSYAVSGKWSLNGTKTCIEHKAVYAVTSPSYKLITKPARSYCYQFPKDGLAGLGLGKKWGDYRLATRQIPAFITENKNPGKYKKYNLAVVVNVAQKTGMIFLKHYKIASQKVKYRLARNKKRKKRAIREQKEKEHTAIKQAQQKAEQKARVKREMSTLSSFKNARG
ncbi:MAG: hypothetical protein VX794_04690, partial [Nitrospinota bacterium]|nr:hypothetical protein [Nitrospinota bacterium]